MAISHFSTEALDACERAGMTPDELIGYCALHCESERALFSGAQLSAISFLAGEDTGGRGATIQTNGGASANNGCTRSANAPENG